MRRQPTTLIDAAVAVLRKIDRPASAHEIVAEGRMDPELKRFFGGKTPFKTVNARISVDIHTNKDRSRFFRFAPATYGLREDLEAKKYEQAYRTVYFGRNRRKEVSNELVAAVRSDDVDFFKVDGFYDSEQYPISVFDIIDIIYEERRRAEKRSDLKQLVSYAYIIHDDCILSFERGKYTSDNGEFIGKYSIGFGGHINYDDLSLFDNSPVGLEFNIVRELSEELYLFSRELIGNIEDIRFRGFLCDSSTENGRRHLGLAASVKLKNRLEIETPTLGIRNLRWISAKHTPNGFDRFEIWSQYLFRHIQRVSEKISW